MAKIWRNRGETWVYSALLLLPGWCGAAEFNPPPFELTALYNHSVQHEIYPQVRLYISTAKNKVRIEEQNGCTIIANLDGSNVRVLLPKERAWYVYSGEFRKRISDNPQRSNASPYFDLAVRSLDMEVREYFKKMLVPETFPCDSVGRNHHGWFRSLWSGETCEQEISASEGNLRPVFFKHTIWNVSNFSWVDLLNHDLRKITIVHVYLPAFHLMVEGIGWGLSSIEEQHFPESLFQPPSDYREWRDFYQSVENEIQRNTPTPVLKGLHFSEHGVVCETLSNSKQDVACDMLTDWRCFQLPDHPSVLTTTWETWSPSCWRPARRMRPYIRIIHTQAERPEDVAKPMDGSKWDQTPQVGDNSCWIGQDRLLFARGTHTFEIDSSADHNQILEIAQQIAAGYR
jgi:hypothetical protein